MKIQNPKSKTQKLKAVVSSQWSVSNPGFTLIELLVVIAILGILATIALVAIRGAQASARDAQRKSDLADIRSTLEIIRADCGKYPTTIPFAQTTNWDIGYNATTCPNLSSGTTNTYMSKVPQDPQVNRGGVTYQYVFDSTNNRYTLCSYLEHPGSTSGGQCGGSGGTCGTGGQLCFYTLTSP